jgi:uncharacterized protein
MAAIDYERLYAVVTAQYHGDAVYSPHGPAHWRRVERNGLLLATRTRASVEVIRLFAIFHDSRRMNDGTDDQHGARGAAYAAQLCGEYFLLPDRQLDLLLEACRRHTHGLFSPDPTIGTCWDADRLDLGRVGMVPNPAFMSTAFGKEIAICGSIQPFLDGPRE